MMMTFFRVPEVLKPKGWDNFILSVPGPRQWEMGQDKGSMCAHSQFHQPQPSSSLLDWPPTSVLTGSWTESGARSTAVQYLKMDEPKLREHCQKQGLRSEGLSVEDLRILLIQHASQPALEAAKGEAEKIRGQELGRGDREPKEREPCQAQDRRAKEQAAAQAQQQKREWELLLPPQKKQPDKSTPKSFTPFSPGGSPTAFLSHFERAAQKQKVTAEEYMIYLPPLLRGELADFYQNLPERGSVTYPVFREAVSKHFRPAATGKPIYYVTAFFEVGKEASSGIREAVVVRDRQVVGVVSTGSDVSVICADLVSPSDIVPGETFLIQFLTGRCTVQVAHLPIGWRGKTSLVKVGVVEDLVVPMIIGRDVLCRDCQSFVIAPRQWTEWEAAHTEEEFQPMSRPEREQISSGRPAATAEASTNARKGGNWALRETLEKAEPPAEGDWPTRSSREEENGDLRRQRGGLRVVPGCQSNQSLGLIHVFRKKEDTAVELFAG
ncbi:hypothetical protein lerEdw1_013111 [Lerista edwardsae]|nr:hypothetical protein lerEdw1_013111 [Lerista edwardsae]